MDNEVIKALVKCKNRDGEILTKSVVDAARPEDSPLHRYFDWDDSVAAEKHREAQARSLIQRFSVVFTSPEGREVQTRAFFNVTVSKERKNAGAEPVRYRAYRSIEDCVADEELRAQILREALATAKSWQRKYEILSELGPVFEAIKVVERNSMAYA